MNKKYTLIFNPQIYVDIQNQVDYYFEETKSHTLGQRFVEALKIGLKKLESNPFLYEVKYSDVRCLPIEKFPHRAHYRIVGTEVFVEAVFGTKENPVKWKRRIKKRNE